MGMDDLITDIFKKNNLSSTLKNYNNEKDLQEAREKHQEAQNEYRRQFRTTLDSNEDMKKDMFITINKGNAINSLKIIHKNYREAIKELILQKKINDSKTMSDSNDDVNVSSQEVKQLQKLNLDLDNIIETNKRKTDYELESLKSIRSYRSTFISIYIFLCIVFLLLMFKKGK